MIESDENLVQSAQGGDRAAFEELVRRTSRLVFAKLYLETGDTHLAEDLLQDTLLAAFRNLDQLTEPTKFRAWLLRIAQNQAIDAMRRGLRQKRQEKPNLFVIRAGIPAAARRRSEPRRIAGKGAMAVLRARCRSEYRFPLTLRVTCPGRTTKTIQAQMGLTNGSCAACSFGA